MSGVLPWDQRLARGAVKPLARVGVTPNQVTTLSLFLGLAAAGLYGWGNRDLGAVLFIASTLLDHVDGELARLTGTTSRFGHYYDHVTGGVCYVVLFVGIGIGLRHGDLGGWAILMGILAGIAVSAIFSMRVFMEHDRGDEFLAQPSFAGFEIEDVLYLVGPITWFGALLPFLVAACVGAPIFAAWQVWVFLRAPEPDD